MAYQSNNKKLNNLIDVAFKSLLESSRDMIFVKDINLVYAAASMPFVKMVGKNSLDEIVNKTDLDIFEDKSLAKRYVLDDKKLLSKGENLVDYIEPITDFDGRARYGSTSKYILCDEEGNTIGILGITRDITRDYIARQHYQQELKYLFELPADTYAVSYIDVDSWRIISQRRQNINGANMQACNTVEELCEAALISIADTRCKATDFYSNFTPEYLKNIYDSGRSNMSFRYQRLLSDGSTRWVHNEVRFLIDVDNGHLCLMLSAKDIDKEKKEEQKLAIAAQMDKMTMVYNRATTMDKIKQALLDDADNQHVLFMIDVDNFKNLNDTLGHQSGDEFLIALANEIKKNFRERDIVGRIGGDEFFVLMRNIADVSIISKKAQDLVEGIQSISFDYTDLHISGSIGVSLYPDNGRSLDELYAKADSALYDAKKKGKNQYVFAD